MEPEVYDAFFHAEDRHWWFAARRRILDAVLTRLYPRGGLDIADVGCGTGGMLLLLGRYGVVTGVDEAPEARDYCARRGFPGILTPEAWNALPDRYDLVTSFDVVEHVEDDVGFLGSLARRLRPDGRVLLTVPAYPFLWSVFDELNHHKRRYTRDRLRLALTGAGLEVERLTHFNALLLPPIAAVRIVERAAGRKPDPAEVKRSVHRWFKVGPMNGILESLFASERHWVAGRDLPAGCSILAVARLRDGGPREGGGS